MHHPADVHAAQRNLKSPYPADRKGRMNSRGTVLVTGASSGIGAAYATRLARDGRDLIVVARRLERLNELADRLKAETGLRVEVVKADLTDPDELARVSAKVSDERALNLLVNNAGFGSYGPFPELSVYAVHSLIAIHTTADSP